MKGVVIALAILLLAVSGVVGNALYVHHVTDELRTGLDALPATPDPSTTPAAVSDLRRTFADHACWLGISVSTTVLDRTGETLAQLETHARLGSTQDYAATLTLLRELVSEIVRLETLALKNIL